jgi:hypothetical protein
LGEALAGQKKFTEAEPLLLAGVGGMTRRRSRIPFPSLYYLGRAQQWVASLYKEWGKPQKAALCQTASPAR